MKIRSLSLVALIDIAVSGADFDDAFKNGKLSGDATVTYEMRDADKGVYYTDNAHSVGSAELSGYNVGWIISKHGKMAVGVLLIKVEKMLTLLKK